MAQTHESDVLHVSSTVLDVSVSLPGTFDTNEAVVTMSLFEPQNGETDASFERVTDSLVQYATKYRVELDPNKADRRFVLRVYVEASATPLKVAGMEENRSKFRAFYARWVDLSPSEPRFMSCEDDHDAENEDGEERVLQQPLTNMPSDLCSRYTMDGQVPVRKWYFDDQTGAERRYGEEFSRETIEAFIEDARNHVVRHSTVDVNLYAALQKYSLKDKRVLIFGSNGHPWIESVCLAHEAASCTTLARNQLHYNHSSLQTFTTAEFYNEDAVADNRQHYDVVFAVNTIASEGLGRAGDPLDPDGDLKVIQELRKLAMPSCTTKMNAATVFLAVPVGPDTLVWNAQRQYGPLRLPLLLQDWQLVDSFGFDQNDFTSPLKVSHLPLFVLQTPSSCDKKNAESSTSGQHTEL
ncbi:Hypothetical protein PHPALM_12289 [Phytophthora palmivora]|uniref:Uncharacterized protein n=1 Tax=Phytophthora palmivora TaxID=4796 RepID=A0A2P4Y042_9STRA|nr:Hypothetical protein PHPALM_12289 [Phytophthora palmivora]